MSAFEQVYQLSEQLYQLVLKPLAKDARDERIEQITSLLEKREQLLPKVQPPFTSEEKELFQQIRTWNDVITAKFTELKVQIQQDMIQTKKSKKTSQQYVNPYQNVSTSDGMFYDKRK